MAKLAEVSGLDRAAQLLDQPLGVVKRAVQSSERRRPRSDTARPSLPDHARGRCDQPGACDRMASCMWRTEEAPELAADIWATLGRVGHVQTDWTAARTRMVAEVGIPPTSLRRRGFMTSAYAPRWRSPASTRSTARRSWLDAGRAGWSGGAWSAHHTGATLRSRGARSPDELGRFSVPDADELDASESARPGVVADGAIAQTRESESTRSSPATPRVTRPPRRRRDSHPELLASALRGRVRLGLSDVWPAGVLEGVGEAQPH